MLHGRHAMHLSTSVAHVLQLGFNLLGYVLLRFRKPRYLPLKVSPLGHAPPPVAKPAAAHDA